MSDKSIFVFGSKIFEERPKRDAITTLPLEMAWKIFSYLDDQSLRAAYHTIRTWSRIIYANKNLRKRLNVFELALELGSKELAKFHLRNMKRIKKERRKKNYLSRGEERGDTIEKEIILGTKRSGEKIPFRVKRLKLF